MRGKLSVHQIFFHQDRRGNAHYARKWPWSAGRRQEQGLLKLWRGFGLGEMNLQERFPSVRNFDITRQITLAQLKDTVVNRLIPTCPARVAQDSRPRLKAKLLQAAFRKYSWIPENDTRQFHLTHGPVELIRARIAGCA